MQSDANRGAWQKTWIITAGEPRTFQMAVDTETQTHGGSPIQKQDLSYAYQFNFLLISTNPPISVAGVCLPSFKKTTNWD